MEDFTVPGEAEFTQLVGELATSLTARGWKLATAESCTGGWIAKCCTDRAGSSGWFERGYITYSNAAKREMLRLDAGSLEQQGAVSSEVALQMADGARRSAGAQIAVAVTGIAGPDGGTEDKPVGTVWFGWSLAGRSETEVVRFAGDRDAVRRQTVAHALQGLIKLLIP